MCKICVVDCGWISNIAHGPAYVKYKTDCSDTVLAGCGDIKKNVHIFAVG